MIMLYTGAALSITFDDSTPITCIFWHVEYDGCRNTRISHFNKVHWDDRYHSILLLGCHNFFNVRVIVSFTSLRGDKAITWSERRL